MSVHADTDIVVFTGVERRSRRGEDQMVERTSKRGTSQKSNGEKSQGE